MEKVLITGITGFVGSHIADLCLKKEIKPYGFRRYHLSNMRNIKHIEDKIIHVGLSSCLNLFRRRTSSLVQNVCALSSQLGFLDV